MKMQFVFGNPYKKSSFPKKGNALKSKGKVKSLLERLKMGKKKNPYNKPAERKKLEKLMYQDLKKLSKRSEAAKKGQEKKKLKQENKKLKKAVSDLEQMEMELLDSSIKEKKMAKKKKGSKKSPAKKKVAKKKVAKKKVAKKKVAKKKVAKKVAPKRRRKVAKKVAPKRRRKTVKKAAKRRTRRVRKTLRRRGGGGGVHYLSYNTKTKPRYTNIKRMNKRKKGIKRYFKTKKGKKFSVKMLNPLGGSMSKIEKFTGMSMPEAGGLLVGGLAYGAVNSLLSKIPGVKIVHGQLLKVPVVGSALPTLLAGALLNWAGDKYKMKAASMLGKGLVGAAVVGMGVNASQMVPGLKGMGGVDFTMGEGQLGLNEADFGEDNPADFGELIDYNTQALSGVDYTMSGVDFTMGEDNPADFGELIDYNSEALSGGQLG